MKFSYRFDQLFRINDLLSKQEENMKKDIYKLPSDNAKFALEKACDGILLRDCRSAEDFTNAVIETAKKFLDFLDQKESTSYVTKVEGTPNFIGANWPCEKEETKEKKEDIEPQTMVYLLYHMGSLMGVYDSYQNAFKTYADIVSKTYKTSSVTCTLIKNEYLQSTPTKGE